jgi:hypothetical protein
VFFLHKSFCISEKMSLRGQMKALIIYIYGDRGEASREASVESRGQLKKKLNACVVAGPDKT